MHLRTALTLRLLEPRVRIALTLSSAACLLAAIVAVFWFQDLRYARPTPIPVRYAPPVAGALLPLPLEMAGTGHAAARPVLLHFFNRDCPCSRFNVDQARALADRFRDRVRFVLVLQLPAMSPTERQRALNAALQKFAVREGVVDIDGKMASRYGVYSTPQAVILDANGAMAYRGNYNASRYCANPATEFARMALEAVLAGRQPPALPTLAYQAYGCELPAASVH